jgi:hypothetical protein
MTPSLHYDYLMHLRFRAEVTSNYALIYKYDLIYRVTYPSEAHETCELCHLPFSGTHVERAARALPLFAPTSRYRRQLIYFAACKCVYEPHLDA